jgi:5-methylthioadenosine/S-adenosylhomocysteine deaminase
MTRAVLLLSLMALGACSAPDSREDSATASAAAPQPVRAAGTDSGPTDRFVPADAADVVIHGGTLVTMDPTRRVLVGGALVIRGERIAAILEPGQPLPPAQRVIDARDHLVIPGLVNTHGHVPMVLFRGLADDMPLLEWLNDFIFPAEAKTVDADFSYWGTLLAGVEMVRSGTTTFSDMYYFEDRVAEACVEIGLRGVLGQTIIGFKAPDYATPADALKGSEAFLKRWKGHPLVTPSVAPHAFYTTELETVRACVALARRYGVPLQIHAAESVAEDEAVRKKHGARALKLLRDGGLLGKETLIHHGITLTAEDRKALASLGASISHNPESNMKGASGLADVKALLEAGVAVGIGTDGAAGNNNLDMFEELDSCAKLHKLLTKNPAAMPAKQVFELATLGGARALKLGDKIGSLEAGKLADVVLVDLRAPELTPLYDVYSQLVYAIKGGHVRSVFVHGKLIVEDREVLTVDVARVVKEAKRISLKVLAAVDARREEKARAGR